MKTTYKRLAGGLTAGLLMWTAAREAGAVQGNPVNLIVTVTIQSLDITATFRAAAGATYALGNVAAGSNNLITDPITITNSGNVTETYNLRIPSEPNGTWSSVTAVPVAEQYQMAGVFRSSATAAPGTGDYVDGSDDYSVSTVRTADGTNILAVNGDGSGAANKGYQMLVNSNIYLWLKFRAPSSTAITTQQSITTRITAATP